MRFFESDSVSAFLKVNDNCYVRCRDISVVGTGVKDAQDGSEMVAEDTVVLQLVNGSVAAFQQCASEAEAQALAATLVVELEALERRRRTYESNNR